MARAPQQYPPALQMLYLYLTQGCNLACRHCWLAPKLDPDGSHYPTLSVALLERAVEEAKPLGLGSVKLTGGEPLLHPEILAILDLIRQHELGLVIETNGTLCSKVLAEQISRFPQRSISVSIDGADAATHEAVRIIEGSFDDAWQGVENLVTAGTAPQIIMTVMRSNADQLKKVVRLAEKAGASSVKFNIVQPTSRGEGMHTSGEALSVDELMELGRYVEQTLAPASKLRLFFDLPLAFRSLGRIASGDGCSVCSIRSVLGIIPSGHYALCGIGEHIPELVFGEVGKDPLEEVWTNHPRLREIREGLPGKLEGVCATCLMKHACLGSCLAQNFYRTGSFWAPFWYCDQAEREGLFPVSRSTIVPGDEEGCSCCHAEHSERSNTAAHPDRELP